MANFIGKFQGTCPLIEGEKDGKRWARCTALFVPDGNNDKIVALTLFGVGRVQMFDDAQVGQFYQVFYQLKSRERDGRWYTDAEITSAVQLVRDSVGSTPF